MLANPLSKYSIHLDILTSAASDHSIRLETLAAPLFKHPIRFGVPAMDEKLPQRGYTFDSPGLPTIGGYPGEQGVWDATPLGVVLFVNGTITPNG